MNSLLAWGRHAFVSCLISSQKWKLASPLIRVNMLFLLVWRLRNRLELQSLLEEISAVYPVKVLEEMYELAVSEPHSFWYILLTAKKREDMFYLRFESEMTPTDKEKQWEQKPQQQLGPLQVDSGEASLQEAVPHNRKTVTI